MDKSKRIKDEILGILAVVGGLIVLLSLLTYNRWDPSLSIHGSSKGADVQNLLGIFGSYLSDAVLQLIGITAFIIPLLLCAYGLKKLLGKETGRETMRKTIISAAATVTLILSISSLLSLVFLNGSAECPRQVEPILSYSNINCHSGGVVGFLVTKLSTSLFSITGSYMIFIPLLFVTLMFLVPFSVMDFLKGAREKVSFSSMSIPFKETLKERRKKKKEKPEIEMDETPSVQTTTYRQEPLPLAYPAEQKTRAARKTKGEYELPSLELLKDPVPVKSRPAKEDLLSTSDLLEKKLRDFSVDGKVTHVSPGPVVTMFEFEPAPGVKINRVLSLSDDLALTLKTTSLRISPIAGKSTLGLEVPNSERETVYLKEIFASEAYRKSPSKLTLALGKDIFGVPVVADLARMPHLLIAGATGSGKSVGINVMVLSLLYRATPKEVKMLMIDPKMLELPAYEEIPHLMLPIITSVKDAADALRSIVFEMERRYRLLAEVGSRNIETYNKKIRANPDSEEEPLPYIIIFIDEFADFMLVSPQEVENSIARLAQMARAAGIHLILATQRPSVDVITGVIKANFSSRLSFNVASKLDSRIILDTYGAEQLLGKGDMLYVTPGARMTRVHGAYVSEEEVRIIVDFIKAQGPPDYSIFESLAAGEQAEIDLTDRDELYQQALDVVLNTGQATISYIQRRLKIGYNRAARIMEMMEEDGIVGPPGEAGKPREILRRKK
ncbi:DNA translocase FtsK [bacterium BMS3Bbin08]|nr:DNA translocase FtsK [bacterium BMS3Bbin08]